MNLALSAVLLCWVTPDEAFNKALASLRKSESVSVAYTTKLISGDRTEWSLKLLKPNYLLAESDSKVICFNAWDATWFDKRKRTYRTEYRSPENWKALLSQPDFILARMYFEREPSWLGTIQPAPARTRNGVKLPGVQFPLENGLTALAFTSPTEPEFVLLQVDRVQDGSMDTRLIDKIQLSKATLDPKSFENFLPAGAIPEASVSQPLSDEAKEEAANGYVPYRRLTWDDFKIADGRSATIIAYTKAFIHYSIKWNASRSGAQYRAVLTHLEIRSGINLNETWRKSQIRMPMDRLLRHEQGHLDINEIEAKKLRKIGLSTWVGYGSTTASAGADLGVKVKAAVDQAIRRAQETHNQYDSETIHGLKTTAQGSWFERIRKELEQAS